MSVAQRAAYLYRKTYLRKAFLICSYFTKPSQGIKGWEELSRTSSYFLRTPSTVKSKRFHIISAAHTTHPFFFPKFYPVEWPRFLRFLTTKDCKNTLQIRDPETGKILDEFALTRHSWVKHGKDLVVTHLEDEAGFINALHEKYNMEPPVMTLTNDLSSVGEHVTLVGHDFTKNDKGEEVFVPCSLTGHIAYSGNTKYLIHTNEPSVMGMCGGPVLIGDPEKSTTSIGMVEARVSVNINPETPDDPHQAALVRELNDRTVILGAQEIASFLPKVEAEMDDRYLADSPSAPKQPTDFIDNF